MKYKEMIAVVCGAVLAACGPVTPADRMSDSAGGEAAPPRPLSWAFEAPSSWDEQVRIVNEPDEAARLATQGIHSARMFEYLPRDTTEAPQPLLGIWVYDSTAWARLAMERGPPRGEEIARGPGVVYIAGIARTNPFSAGGADSVEFQRRSITLDEVRRAFRVVR